ncbi:16S rRNA (cytosine(967)-C(5))-methyltransferase RsmB [Aciduricibacillus chroicocephali]|uniref:16S rRNA (cytosine(967)-C(5))-methyltransferase n=1 Tax=Aciduricibacillus chroicocephali TaxID=3054939 RepID=A0ABY9KXV8_9BACI|nr:16S rRNA (cytosine(967)-C(5))-methyltransferase RsmB [Bacillaceae bacterium 44XB]
MSKYKLRNGALDILERIEQGGFSHLLIDNVIKSGQIDSKDEGLLTEIVYGTVQRRLTLDYVIESYVKNPSKMKKWVINLLRMSIYQMVYLDRVPDHAIIHEAVEIAKQRGHKGIASLVNGVLRTVQREGMPDVQKISDPVTRLAIETSTPEWLISRWVKEYGYDTALEMGMENLRKRPLTVRVQPLRIKREDALNELKAEGYEVSPSLFSEQGIIVEKGNILKSRLFKEHLITVQDQSSMLVGEMLDVQPGMRVLDACSAPGGKTTHIAEKMQNDGEVFAFDIHDKKAKLVKNKAGELGLSIISAEGHDARKLQDKFSPESFDRVLVDAPCSGIGVVRGKPDIKYNKQESDIYNLARIQEDILDSIAPLLKKGGKLVYSTCTVDKAENEEIVQKFLEKHSDFEVDQQFFKELPEPVIEAEGISENGLQLFPQSFGTDGFFLVRLCKKQG